LIYSKHPVHHRARMSAPNESFLVPLREAGFRVSWVPKVAGVDVKVGRDEAITRLLPHHEAAASALGAVDGQFWRCEQVHGNLTLPVRGTYQPELTTGADGLATSDPDAVLGVYVADCGALYIGDPVQRAVAVVHSGKVGTEKNILGATIAMMQREYDSSPSDLIVSLAPCIRPPAYEVDFAAQIRQQALAAGVLDSHYYDCDLCTTSDPDCYYSYRQEQGQTGRMLALIAV